MEQDRGHKIVLGHSKLIPRNNWDYDVKTLFYVLAHFRNGIEHAPNAEAFFHQRPVWTTSGRASLYAILKSLDLPQGSKIGVPLFCCSVVFNAIYQAGFTPCFIDSNLDDCNISVKDVRNKQKDLAALVVVHMFGYPCDMDAILETVGTMPVIEDCAQSMFSIYKGRRTGLLSTASFFSFRCGKYISAGEGSAIICRDAELHRKVERLAASFEPWSKSKMIVNAFSTLAKATLYNRPWYGLIGRPVGMRLDKKLNLTAKDGFETGKIASSHLALIDARIASFEEKIAVQKEHARMLINLINPGKLSLLPKSADGSSGNWFQFSLRFETSSQRDAMAQYLLSQGIDTAKYLDTIADEACSSYGYHGDCPNAELHSKTILLVPIHYTLNTHDMEHIGRSINAGAARL